MCVLPSLPSFLGILGHKKTNSWVFSKKTSFYFALKIRHGAVPKTKRSLDVTRSAFVRPPKGPGAVCEEIKVVLNLQQHIPEPAKSMLSKVWSLGVIIRTQLNQYQFQQNINKNTISK